jgi:hypothetical protein
MSRRRRRREEESGDGRSLGDDALRKTGSHRLRGNLFAGFAAAQVARFHERLLAQYDARVRLRADLMFAMAALSNIISVLWVR